MMVVETANVFVALGSNLGESARTLLRAWVHLGRQEGITVTELSPPYLTAPVDMASHHWFTNAVGRLSTRKTPPELLATLLETENLFGRIRHPDAAGYEDRTLDLDLIYYDSLIHDDPSLTLPHPHRAGRLFVLAPLAAIAPDFIDPEYGLTITAMHDRLLACIKSGQTASQELTIGTWPTDTDLQD